VKYPRMLIANGFSRDEDGGRINAVGVHRIRYIDSLPYEVNRLGIVVSAELCPHEIEQNHMLQLQVIDEDRVVLVTYERLLPPQVGEVGQKVFLDYRVRMESFQVTMVGAYEVTLHLDDQYIVSEPFVIMLKS
jgi:hypothetical protein